MKSNFYNVVLDILSVISLFAGIIMFFFSSEQKEKFVTYKRSRYIAGIVFFLYGILCYVHSNFELRSTNIAYARAFSLFIYYISGFLFSYSLIPLLNKHYITRQRKIQDSIHFFIFSLLIAGAVLLNSPYSTIAFAASAIYFFTNISRISILFVKSYRTCVNDIDNYYSEYNVKSYIDWMYKASLLIAIYGLSFTFVVYTNAYFITIFSFIGIFLMVYIVVAFNNYLMYVEKINISQGDDTKECTEKTLILNDSLTYGNVGDRLNQWIEQKKYLMEGITIVTLCVELNTNRTYLSCYINSTYKYSFRDFISTLRVGEAKRLLKEEGFKDISEIAVMTGFSSTSNFYRTFKNFENETPSNYRKRLVS